MPNWKKGLFVFIFLSFSLPLLSKTIWWKGEYLSSHFDLGLESFTISHEETGKKINIYCDAVIIKKLNELSKDSKLHISVKTEPKISSKNISYYCTSQPIVRKITKKAIPEPPMANPTQLSSKQHFSIQVDNGERFVIGQILNADPESGLLTIQTGTRKTYLKINPIEAKQIQEKLEKLEVQKIHGVYYFDRNLGYYVQKTNPLTQESSFQP